MELPGVATFRFDSVRTRVTAYPERGTNSALLHSAYRHAALPIALHYFGAEVLHASAVRTPAGVVAFCAVSETGKSTMAATLGARGYPLWADDALAVEVTDDGSIQTVSLPFDLHLRPASAAYLTTSVRPASGPARVSEFATSQLAALCVLERSEPGRQEVEIERLTAGRSFAALLPHAFSFSLKDAERKRLMLQRYLRIVARTPTFRVAFVPGFDRLPAVLDALERSIDGFTGNLNALERQGHSRRAGSPDGSLLPLARP